MNKKEIKILLNSLYCGTLSVYPVSVRKELQQKILDINKEVDN